MKTIAMVLLGAAVIHLAGCGGETVARRYLPPEEPPPPTTADPAYHLGTERFTTHQPQVLKQIGAHHAYPEFNLSALPTYMLEENESRGGEFVLLKEAVERFLERRLKTSRWRAPRMGAGK